MAEVVILGAGAFAREVYDWCTQAGRTVSAFAVGLDVEAPDTLRGLPVVRGPNAALSDDATWVMGAGTAHAMTALATLAEQLGLQPAEAVVHPNATLGSNNRLGPGSLIAPGCVVTCDIEIGRGSVVNIGATIGHDTVVGSFTHLSPNVSLSGNTRIGARCEIGTAAVFIPDSSVADDSIVGAGAVVTGALPKGVHVGVPAKTLPPGG